MAIAGRYPVRPFHHHASHPIPGNDGVGLVERIGAVIPKRHGLGTWRSHAALPAGDLLRLPAALLKMGAAPAYLLLEDGAARPLRRGGADVVVDEGELERRGAAAHPELEAAVARKRVVLVLDAVFGRAGEHIAGLLAPGAMFVNYGSLGGADGVLRLTQDLLFWKQVKFRNFRLPQQLSSRSGDEQERLLAWFGDLLLQGKLKTPVVERVTWSQDVSELLGTVKSSLELATQRPLGVKKQVFVVHQ